MAPPPVWQNDAQLLLLRGDRGDNGPDHGEHGPASVRIIALGPRVPVVEQNMGLSNFDPEKRSSVWNFGMTIRNSDLRKKELTAIYLASHFVGSDTLHSPAQGGHLGMFMKNMH